MNIIEMTAAVLLLAPVGVVCVQCLALLLPARWDRKIETPRPDSAREPLVVLIPAHDEETCLGETLRSVQSQLRFGDRILVVADNCADRTAEVARDAGAEVIKRIDSLRRGKGHALSFGVEHLRKSERAPRVTIVIDADCTAEPGAIEALAARTLAIGRPVQAIYLLDQPPGAGTSQSLLSGMAFLVRNGVRPGGANRLGLPCLLTGSGMAFPWEVLSKAKLDSGNLVEDMQLGIDLAIAGWPACLCEEARIVGRLPTGTKAALTQRRRWEHGHLLTAISQVPRLAWTGFRKGRLAPLAMAMDLCVPPLSLLTLLIFAAILASAAAAVFAGASWGPTEVLVCGAALLFLSLTIGCAKFGRASLPAAALLALPTYLLWKLPIYLGFISHRQIAWIRTPRSPIAGKNAAESAATAKVNAAETVDGLLAPALPIAHLKVRQRRE